MTSETTETTAKEKTMGKKIYLVGGSKGGVGKSMVAMMLIELLRGLGQKILLIETDTSNPDLFRAYGEEVQTEMLDLDVANGWSELVNIADAHPELTVIVNTAARNNRGVEVYGETLRESLAELGRELVTLWVINAEADSVDLLKRFMEVIPSETHVVRNAWFGADEDFFYNHSKTRLEVERRGGKSVTFPVLGSRVANELRTKGMSIARGFTEMKLGNRAELRRWKRLADESLSGVVVAA
jgi:hypothetical protein